GLPRGQESGPQPPLDERASGDVGSPLAMGVTVPATLDRQGLGKTGEDLACRELERRGYVILARRYRTRFGEIDIVSDDRGVIVFVEVKARTSNRHGWAAEAVLLRQQRGVGRVALH